MTKSKKAKEDEERPEKITATDAKREYTITAHDLAKLPCEVFANPHYRSAGPMKLYLLEDIRRVSKENDIKKEAERQYGIDHAEEIEAAKQEERRRLKAAELDRSKAFMSAWRPIATDFEDSGTPLAHDLWLMVMGKLWEDLEPEGMRGLSVVVRDLVNLRLACKELNVIVGDAFRELAERCTPKADSKLWDRCLMNPMGLSVVQLKKMAAQLGNRISVPKPVLVAEIFRKLGLAHPISAPARVYLDVRQEKSSDSLVRKLCPADREVLERSRLSEVFFNHDGSRRSFCSNFQFRLVCMREYIECPEALQELILQVLDFEASCC